MGKPRLLLLGDASAYHTTLAAALRRLGCEVTLATDGCLNLQVDRDIDLRRPLPGKPGGLLLWLRLWHGRRRLSGHDAVLINGAHPLGLRPHRTRRLLQWIKNHNGAIYKTALGTNPWFMQEALDPSSPLLYNEYRPRGEKTLYDSVNAAASHPWLAPALVEHERWVDNMCDGTFTALYEYQLAELRGNPGGNVTYLGIPVDTAALPFAPPTFNDGSRRVRVLFPQAPGRETIKGTDIFEQALTALHPAAREALEVRRVSSLTFKEFLDELQWSDIVLDQVHSYTPATTALMAMAMGKTVFTGAERDYLEYIGHRGDAPMVNATCDAQAIARRLEELAANPSTLATTAPGARQFAATHNDSTVVARRLLDALGF